LFEAAGAVICCAPSKPTVAHLLMPHLREP
jgi:hypothetical protein